MEMHKIEVYTQQRDLAQVLAALPEEPLLVGALDVHFRQNSELRAQSATADTRLEIFTESNPAEVAAQLSPLDIVFDIRSHPCRPLLTLQNFTDTNAVSPSASAHCRINALSGNSIRVTVDTSSDQTFLFRVFQVLAGRGANLIGGRKYRQGTKDVFTFTATAPVIGNNQQLQDDILGVLAQSGFPETVSAKGAADPCDNILIRLDNSSNLPALIIRAAGNTNLIRESLQQILYRYELDTVIARFTPREDGIEDIYYLKELSNTAVTEELARTIEKTIQGGCNDQD